MSGCLRVQPATPNDVDELLLRKEDSREVSEGWRELVKGAVAGGGVEAYRDPSGALAGLFGVTAPGPNFLSPWLLCSDVATRHGRDVMRIARLWTSRLRIAAQQGLLVSNAIPKDSPRNRAFVERLGFVITSTPGDGPDFFNLPPHV